MCRFSMKASGHKAQRFQWNKVAMPKSTFYKSSFGSTPPVAHVLGGASSRTLSCTQLIMLIATTSFT
ncbi:hypothetical protein BTS2_0814 [Bacillus sp. TS-2]|nr:hypothetical protein BTS2_0814 [Bacillus sp. TS-2]